MTSARAWFQPRMNRLGYAARARRAADGESVLARAAGAILQPTRAPGDSAAVLVRAGAVLVRRPAHAGNLAYNFSWPLRLRGPLDTAALERALAEVVRRHEALRTRFARGGRATGADHRRRRVRSRSTGRRLGRARAGGGGAAARRRGDAAAVRSRRGQGSSARGCSGWPTTSTSCRSSSTTSSSTSGRRSSSIRELSALYEAFAEGRPVAAAGAASAVRRLRGVAAIAADRRRAARGARSLDERARGDARPRSTCPPIARGRPSRACAAPGGGLPLPAELTAGSRSWPEREGATFFDGLLALFDVLLHRYTGEEDFAVGVAGRRPQQPEIDDTIGVLLNTVVVRSDLSGRPSFRDAAAARATSACSRPPRIPSFRSSCSSGSFSRRATSAATRSSRCCSRSTRPSRRSSCAGIEAEEIETEVAAAGVDLFLFLQERARRVRRALGVQHRPLRRRRRSTDARAPRPPAGGRRSTPDRPIAELPMLSDDGARASCCADLERHRSSTTRSVPLHELVEAQVERSPDARRRRRARTSSSPTRELDARANQLARHLRAARRRARIARRGQPRALARSRRRRCSASSRPAARTCRSTRSFREERLAFMLADSGAEVLVTESALLARLPPIRGPHRPSRRGLADDRRPRRPTSRVAGRARTTSPTSSTRPARRAGRRASSTPIAGSSTGCSRCRTPTASTASDRLLQKTPISFDVSVREVFWPLLTGALPRRRSAGRAREPCLPRRADRARAGDDAPLRPVDAAALPRRRRTRRRCRSLRCVLCGGEAAARSTSCGASSSASTASCTTSTARPRPRSASPPGAATPRYERRDRADRAARREHAGLRARRATRAGPRGRLGRALHRRRPGRAGLSRRPGADRGAVRRRTPSARAASTATGDLGRWTAEGVLEFGGRIDDQVKVRGFRVELGRDRGGPARARGRRRAARSSRSSRRTARTSSPPTSSSTAVAAASRRALRPARRSSRASCPTTWSRRSFTVLDDLPLLPNGKLDRSALPEPGAVGAAGRVRRAARRETERAVARVWAELLGVERVGRNDNFFALGGHSLLAARLVGRVVQAFRRRRAAARVPPGADRRRHSRRAFDASRVGARSRQLPPLVARTGRPRVLVRAGALLVRRADHGQQRGLQHSRRVCACAVTSTFPSSSARSREIVRRHEILRTRFAVEDGRPVQVVEPLGPSLSRSST